MRSCYCNRRWNPTCHLRARTSVEDGAVLLEPLAGQESHMIARAAVADALVLVRRGDGEVPAGSAAEYLAL